jgi:hypothetical protein
MFALSKTWSALCHRGSNAVAKCGNLVPQIVAGLRAEDFL